MKCIGIFITKFVITDKDTGQCKDLCACIHNQNIVLKINRNRIINSNVFFFKKKGG